MAQIPIVNNTSIMKISQFLGLNENPDGDTTLRDGELAYMRNFCITHDRHLQIRAGSKTILSLAEAWADNGGSVYYGVNSPRFCGSWRGVVGTLTQIVAAYGGGLFVVDIENESITPIGKCTQADTSFFGFGNKLYMLNGHEYKSWDGNPLHTFGDVTGYIPVVATATPPAGGGTLLQAVNRLNNLRKVQFSPDGTATLYVLPEQGITAVSNVSIVGSTLPPYSVNTTNGTLTFDSPPAAGTNTLTVTYSKGSGSRAEVTAMRFAEIYNGETDTRVFLYGDNTNRAIYSGLEAASGQPTAEYFPDLYEVAVGESNTPITALVRHYSRLMAFKTNSAWVIQYGSLGLENGINTPAFYVQPVNRQIGNEAFGQVKLVENNPLTLDVGSIYQWQSTNNYSGYITSSENNAKRISDRVITTFRSMDLPTVKTFNIKHEHEYWFLQSGRALILNYANNCWYYYEDLPFDELLEVENEVYAFSEGGKVLHFSRRYRSDDGEDLDCYAETGSIAFQKNWLYKYIPLVFVTMKPESGARVYVTAESNRRSDYPDKLIAYGLSTFEHVDFNHFSFGTNRKPQVSRVKLKVKKAAFYKLIFKMKSASATATIIEADLQLRYAGNVK